MADYLNLPSGEGQKIQNTLLASIASSLAEDKGIKIESWKDLQTITRMGLHKTMFKVGDVLRTTYDDKEQLLDIIGIDHDAPNSMTIQFRDCLDDVQFSAPQALYYCEEPLLPGIHVFTLNNVQYQFTTTETVPEGGQVYVSNWESDEYVPTRIVTYGADRTTIIESDLVVSGGSGSDTLTPVNHHQRCRYGSNNYVESAIRQWLNSDEENFEWEPQTDYDRPSITTVYNKGFLARIDPKLKDVIGKVEKQVARNTVTDEGGQDIFEDKAFLLSRVEVGGGSEGTTTGEKVYPFYDEINDAGRIKLLNNAPRYWWLRSPYPGRASSVRCVGTSGAVNSSGVSYAFGLSPACVII